MRCGLALILAVVLSLGSGGCLMVIGVEKPIQVDGKKRIIEVDGELYVVDVHENMIRKVDRDEVNVEIETD